AAALLAWGAGRALFAAQRNGELELLLSTPLGARDIVGGHWRALCGPLRGAWLLVGFMVFLQFFILRDAGSSPALPMGAELFQRLIGALNTVLDIIALCWVGMWFGLRSRKPFSVMSWTVGLVIGLPWLIAFLMDIGFSLTGASTWGGPRGGEGLLFWLVLSALLFVVKNLLFIRWAAWK